MAMRRQNAQIVCKDLVEDFYKILQHAQSLSKTSRRLRMDLRCVRIALVPISSTDLPKLNHELVSSIQNLERHLQRCIDVFTNHYRASTNGPVDGHGFLYEDARHALEELDEIIPTTLTALNNHHSAYSSYKVQRRYVLIYPGDFRVCRRGGWDQSRYDVLSEVQHVSVPRESSFPGRTIYEHVDILCSGKRVYDPLFFEEDGPKFFTPGRVFTVLWDTSSENSEDAEFFDEDPSVEEGRARMQGWEGSYTGPYEGPTTIRSFLVFKQGEHSCLCLPISTLVLQGVTMQPDQHNYGIIYSGSDDDTPMIDSAEDNIICPALYVPTIPIRQWPTPNIKGKGPPDPSVDRLPTHDLLENSRVDYRRACEVQFGVRVKNVGLLDDRSLRWLKSWDEQQKQEQQQKQLNPLPQLQNQSVGSNSYNTVPSMKKGMKGY